MSETLPNNHHSAGAILYQITECFAIILEDCDWPSLVAISHAGRSGRNRVRQIIVKRMRRVLHDFMDNSDIPTFLSSLEDIKAVVTGRVAWTIMTTALLLPTHLLPNDIRIVTPAQSLPKWRPLLTMFGYNRESKDIMRNKKNPTIKSAIRFYNTHRITTGKHHNWSPGG
ncbi:hypothetical protein Hypma_000846 [Hypsizygus marmoreus]|uniref:Uncharacterized protein n=1 Tax=Hypsizygus marmoreus TaxID=39966 RepID=A0A369JEM1_HYPMA|nr:hypothetical protein Hypma_000846 [Hypsizygus marmoreus]